MPSPRRNPPRSARAIVPAAAATAPSPRKVRRPARPRTRPPAMSAASAEAARRFFASAHFAVAGASQDVNKFGYKLLAWYDAHRLAVTPINPRAPAINVGSTSYTTVANPGALPDPARTSLSVVTPPAVTRALLRDAADAGVPAVWLQPGSFEEADLAWAREHFAAAVGGEEAAVGGEGWCVLVHGQAARKEAEARGEVQEGAPAAGGERGKI